MSPFPTGALEQLGGMKRETRLEEGEGNILD
jgi:hypothetical protein